MQTRGRKFAAVAALSATFLALAGLVVVQFDASSSQSELYQETVPASDRVSEMDAVTRVDFRSDSAAIRAAMVAFDEINEARQSCHKTPFERYSLRSAHREVTEGTSYTLQLVTSTGYAYYVSVDHTLPQYFHPSSSHDEPAALAHYEVKNIAPPPCASTYDRLLDLHEEEVNRENLGWVARADPKMQSLTAAEFKARRMGFNMPKAAPKHGADKAGSAVRHLPPPQFPKNFDSRDLCGHECKAFTVRDQGSCGSCYAFATASALSARMCRNSDHRFNINISPQDIVSCYSHDGCDGGIPILVYEMMYTDGVVADWCLPYVAKDPLKGGPHCGSHCDHGIEFHAANETMGFISRSETEIMQEILINGPVAVGFAIFPDFMMYRSGVYRVSLAARVKGDIGGHAVVMLGWGTDPEHGDYWLCQNSWGDDWGEDGFFRIARGVDEAEIESFGIFYAEPHVPAICPATRCEHGGEILRDCSCRCHGAWSGPTCTSCQLTCHHGDLDPSTCTCKCHAGYSGADCKDKLRIDNALTCLGHAPTLSWDLPAEKLMNYGTYLQVWPKGVKPWNSLTNKWRPAVSDKLMICGDADLWSATTRCPATGHIDITGFPAGEYDAYLIKYLGKNEFGVSRGYARPMLLEPSIQVLGNCGEVSAAKKTQAINEAREANAQTADIASQVEKSARRLRAEVSAVQAEEAGSHAPLPARLEAIPAVAFDTVDFVFTVPEAVDASETLSIHLCPRDEVSPLFGTSLADCRVVEEIAPATPRPDMFRMLTKWLPEGHFQAQLKVGDDVVAVAPLTVARVGLQLMEKDLGLGNLEVTVDWNVSPADAATSKDWVAIYRMGREPNVASCFTHEPATHAPRSEGRCVFELEQGKNGASAGDIFRAEFYPWGEADAAASKEFRWEV